MNIAAIVLLLIPPVFASCALPHSKYGDVVLHDNRDYLWVLLGNGAMGVMDTLEFPHIPLGKTQTLQYHVMDLPVPVYPTSFEYVPPKPRRSIADSSAARAIQLEVSISDSRGRVIRAKQFHFDERLSVRLEFLDEWAGLYWADDRPVPRLNTYVLRVSIRSRSSSGNAYLVPVCPFFELPIELGKQPKTAAPQ